MHSKTNIAILALFLILLSCASPAYAQNLHEDSIEISKTVDSFLTAFTSLKFEKFMTFFDSNATAFFPTSAKIPMRANNKEEIGSIFRKVFDNARKLKSVPPYLDIQPLDLMIQQFNCVAIVTFHLNDPDLFGRRTIVLQNANKKWLIIHLHSSGVPIAK